MTFAYYLLDNWEWIFCGMSFGFFLGFIAGVVYAVQVYNLHRKKKKG